MDDNAQAALEKAQAAYEKARDKWLSAMAKMNGEGIPAGHAFRRQWPDYYKRAHHAWKRASEDLRGAENSMRPDYAAALKRLEAQEETAGDESATQERNDA